MNIKQTILASCLAIICICVLMFVFLSIIGIGCLIYMGTPHQYTTNDIADYGHYTGTFKNKYVQSYITSFFPEELDDSFSNVEYSYRAQKNDGYAFEAYLSFQIEDPIEYMAFVEKYTAGLQKSEFRYDNTYTEYTLDDWFEPQTYYDETTVSISYAKIGKILCAPEKQEIVFIALGVYDGGVARTDFLNVYFNRFEINPSEYAEHSVEEGLKSPYGIPQRGQGDGLREP